MSILKRAVRRLVGGPAAGGDAERLPYRAALFGELLQFVPDGSLKGKRFLEIGPKDGADSRRMAGLEPDELVMIDLPEKHGRVVEWLAEISCPKQYIEQNFMYMSPAEHEALGQFDLIWCTGVLYHNAEQMRFLRRLYKFLNVGGVLVLETATLRGSAALRNGQYIQLFWPDTYRDTGTVTHLPSMGAVKAWLDMVGFREVRDSRCFEQTSPDLAGQRYACLCRKQAPDEAGVYYGKSGLNPEYHFGDAI